VKRLTDAFGYSAVLGFWTLLALSIYLWSKA
jgi:hypothetical protein